MAKKIKPSRNIDTINPLGLVPDKAIPDAVGHRPIVSCCGCVCSECPYFPDDCHGCPDIKGRVFWLSFTGGDVCEIYDCCMNDKKLEHCGKCPELPCKRYDQSDPTKSPEENAEDFANQLKQLRSMP